MWRVVAVMLAFATSACSDPTSDTAVGLPSTTIDQPARQSEVPGDGTAVQPVEGIDLPPWQPVELDLTMYEPPDLNLPGVDTAIDLKQCIQTSTLSNSVLNFARDSDALPSDGPGIETLSKVIDSFVTAKVVQVIGHTSYSDGSFDHNMDLSERRARAVSAFARHRQPQVEFRPAGKGPSEPISTEDESEESRAPNRRVVLSGTISKEKCVNR